MAKMEIGVTLLSCSCEVIAEAGDKLIIFNDSVIGVLPKNQAETIPVESPTPNVAPTFSKAKLIAWAQKKGDYFTIRQANKELLYTGYSAAAALGCYIRTNSSFVRVNDSTERFGVYSMLQE